MNGPGHSLSVLVVDDYPDTAKSTAGVLALDGHSARAARSGEEALRLAAGDPPDVVLLDLQMPGLDGYEVARRLAATPPGKPPVLVAVTGFGAPSDRARTAAAGFHLHLVKPVEPAVLVGLLRRIRFALAPSHPMPATPAAELPRGS